MERTDTNTVVSRILCNTAWGVLTGEQCKAFLMCIWYKQHLGPLKRVGASEFHVRKGTGRGHLWCCCTGVMGETAFTGPAPPLAYSGDTSGINFILWFQAAGQNHKAAICKLAQTFFFPLAPQKVITPPHIHTCTLFRNISHFSPAPALVSQVIEASKENHSLMELYLPKKTKDFD